MAISRETKWKKLIFPRSLALILHLSPTSPLSLRWSSTNPPLSLHCPSTIPFFQAFSVTSFAYLPLPLKQAYALVNPWTADGALRTLVNPDWRGWNLTFNFLVLIYFVCIFFLIQTRLAMCNIQCCIMDNMFNMAKLVRCQGRSML